MPNVEMHGYDGKEAEEVLDRMRDLLQEFSSPGEIVVTAYLSAVEDLAGNAKPFLRLISDEEDIDEMKRLLEPLNADIEVIRLYEWIPKK